MRMTALPAKKSAEWNKHLKQLTPGSTQVSSCLRKLNAALRFVIELLSPYQFHFDALIVALAGAGGPSIPAVAICSNRRRRARHSGSLRLRALPVSSSNACIASTSARVLRPCQGCALGR